MQSRFWWSFIVCRAEFDAEVYCHNLRAADDRFSHVGCWVSRWVIVVEDDRERIRSRKRHHIRFLSIEDSQTERLIFFNRAPWESSIDIEKAAFSKVNKSLNGKAWQKPPPPPPIYSRSDIPEVMTSPSKKKEVIIISVLLLQQKCIIGSGGLTNLFPRTNSGVSV